MNMKTNQSDTKEIQFSQGQKKERKNDKKTKENKNENETPKNDYYANAGN